jgi:signal transduction histidine kinase
MGESSPAGPERPRTAHRSIRFTFVARVVVPAVGLALLWALAVSVALGTVLTGRGLSLRMRFSSLNHRQLTELSLLIATGIVVVLIAVIAIGMFARRLSREISTVTAAAQQLAEEQSPQTAQRLRGGQHAARPDGHSEHSERSGAKTAEAAEATAAIARLQLAAAAAAASEAGLREGLRQMIVSLSRRNQSLLQRQLRLIDTLEKKAADPAALADLFSLDHLTTRMRRHAESLAILSGAAPARSWREPVPVIDVIRGAMAEVEDYTRVRVLTQSDDAVAGSAAADMIHLLAELIENATMFSPSGTPVEIRASRVANGFIVEVDDRGLGMEPAQLAEINEQLATPPDFDLANADRIGLFVGAKLATRYGVRVSLRSSPYGGITAIVLMPSSIVVSAAAAAAAAEPRPGTRPQAVRGASLDLRGGAGPLALVGSRSAQQQQPPQPAAPAAASPAQLLPPTTNLPRRTPTAVAPAAVAPAPAAALPPAPAAPAAAEPAPAPATVTQPAATGTYLGLPRRTRQANLSPHLRDSPPAAPRLSGTELMAAPVAARAPEQARDLAASLQGGWRRGRQTNEPDAPPAAGPPAAEGHDPATPHSEEA